MKIAVISDIHGNLPALKTVLEDIKNREVDRIVCLGDLVGYGPFQNEVVDFIRNENILCIVGNYDTAIVFNDLKYIQDNDLNQNFALPYGVKEVREDNKKALKRFPESLIIVEEGKVINFVHGSPNAINEYLLEDSEQAEKVMKELKEDVLVCAHTHLPYIKKYGDKLLVNDGSIGKPKIGRPNSTYIILTIEEDNVDGEIIEIPYNYEETIKAMEDKNFPKNLINTIKFGK